MTQVKSHKTTLDISTYSATNLFSTSVSAYNKCSRLHQHQLAASNIIILVITSRISGYLAHHYQQPSSSSRRKCVTVDVVVVGKLTPAGAAELNCPQHHQIVMAVDSSASQMRPELNMGVSKKCVPGT